MAQRVNLGVGGLPTRKRSYLAKEEAIVAVPDYKFVLNPVTGTFDRVVNNIEVLKNAFVDGAVPFAESGVITEDNANFLYDNVNNRLKVDSYVVSKDSGKGIKVDLNTPTFGFADILGDQFTKNTGATKPSLTVYNGGRIQCYQFADGDEAFLSYHIPHDLAPNLDWFLHVHWSQISATATGGTLDFKYFSMYAKGHNQASGSQFNATEKTATFSTIDINDGISGLLARQQHLTEVQITGPSATASVFNKEDFEPDGVLELTLEMDANNLTNSGSVLDPFLHFIDLHYRTKGVIGTKSKVPDFYT